MATAEARIHIKAGQNWNRSGTFKIAGVATACVVAACQIRAGRSRDAELVLDVVQYITQDVPGVLQFSIPGEITRTLAASEDYYIDCFVTAGGQTYKNIPTIPCTVEDFVSGLPDA